MHHYMRIWPACYLRHVILLAWHSSSSHSRSAPASLLRYTWLCFYQLIDELLVARTLYWQRSALTRWALVGVYLTVTLLINLL